MTDTNDVVVGSRWRGFSGNLMEVRQVEGDRAYLSYVDDPEDGTWESLSAVVHALDPVRIGPDTANGDR